MNYSTDGFNPSDNNQYRYSPPLTGPCRPHFVAPEWWNREKSIIKSLSAIASVSVLFYILFSGLFVGLFQGLFLILKSIPSFDYNAFSAKWNSPDFQYVFDIVYSLMTIGIPFGIAGRFARKKGLLPDIPMDKPIKHKSLPLLVAGAFGACMFGNIVTSYIDSLVRMLTGFEIKMPDIPTPTKSVGGILIFYLAIAVVPALVEEMAFRGIIMQSLRRYGDMFAIVSSAVIFGLMHCNLQQIPFAIMAGIVIGFAVIETESVWTGVIIHFLNNAFSASVTLVSEFYGMDSPQIMAINVIFYASIAIGVLCAVMYLRMYRPVLKASPLVNCGRNFYGNVPMYSEKVSTARLFKTFFLTAPMIIAFIAVVYQTIVLIINME